MLMITFNWCIVYLPGDIIILGGCLKSLVASRCLFYISNSTMNRDRGW